MATVLQSVLGRLREDVTITGTTPTTIPGTPRTLTVSEGSYLDLTAYCSGDAGTAARCFLRIYVDGAAVGPGAAAMAKSDGDTVCLSTFARVGPLAAGAHDVEARASIGGLGLDFVISGTQPTRDGASLLAQEVTLPDTSPLNLPNLMGWYKADAGLSYGSTSGLVSAWADQSGNENDLAAGSSAPSRVASSINSLPGVSFSSARADTMSFGGVAQVDYTRVFAVGKWNAQTAQAKVLLEGGINGVDGLSFMRSGSANDKPAVYSVSDGSYLNHGSAQTGDHLLIFRADVPGSEAGVAVDDGSETAGTLSVTGGQWNTIGSTDGGATAGGLADFELAELLIFQSDSEEMSTSDVEAVKDYLNARYSLW